LSGGAWYWIRSFTGDQALKPLTVPFESSTSSQFYLASSNRYFIDMTFQTLGPLAGADEDFLTPRAKSIPCDFKVVLTQGGTTLKDEIITSLKPAFRPVKGRVGRNRARESQLSISDGRTTIKFPILCRQQGCTGRIFSWVRKVLGSTSFTLGRNRFRDAPESDAAYHALSISV
jgi:hypothetical protein